MARFLASSASALRASENNKHAFGGGGGEEDAPVDSRPAAHAHHAAAPAHTGDAGAFADALLHTDGISAHALSAAVTTGRERLMPLSDMPGGSTVLHVAVHGRAVNAVPRVEGPQGAISDDA